MGERKGDWIQTYTGARFWPLDPRPEDVHLEDIAHALAHQCRYGGHCRVHYSVAQHSIEVARAVPTGDRRAALLHDAAEAYLVDLPRPVKRMLPGYAEMEAAVWAAIAARFGLPAELPASVHEADERILADEARWLMAPPAPEGWGLRKPGYGWPIRPVPAAEAKRMFLDQATVLGVRS